MSQYSTHRKPTDVLVDYKKVCEIRRELNDPGIEFQPVMSGYMRYTRTKPLTVRQVEAMKALNVEMSDNPLGNTVLRFKQSKTRILASTVFKNLIVAQVVVLFALIAVLGGHYLYYK